MPAPSLSTPLGQPKKPVASSSSALTRWLRRVSKLAVTSGAKWEPWALTPAVVDAVPDAHVIAAGGIADGRGLAAALALGAGAAWIGTRLLLAPGGQLPSGLLSGNHGGQGDRYGALVPFR